MIKETLNYGCKHIIIGIGGSATNDDEVGMGANGPVLFHNLVCDCWVITMMKDIIVDTPGPGPLLVALLDELKIGNTIDSSVD